MKKAWIPFLYAVPMFFINAPVYAVQYLTAEQAQKILFADADGFTADPVTLTDEQKDKIEDLSGKRQRWDKQQVWKVTKAGQQTGWFIVDNVVGKHEFITYALGITMDAHVVGIEVMDYRETHGDEVREASWRQNFVGKTLHDTFRLNKDIPNITGATLSARNLTDGVKRLLALHKVVLTHE